MRVIDVKGHLIEICNLLDVETAKEEEIIKPLFGNNYEQGYKITNWDRIRKALFELNKYEFLSQEINQFLWPITNTSPNSSREFELKLTFEDFQWFCKELGKITEIAHKSIDIISEFFKEDDSEQLNVKLPANLSLSDFQKIIGDLDFILNHCQIIYEANDKQTVTVRKVDSGSIWLVLSVSSVTLGLIGGLAAAGYKIHAMHINSQKSLQDLRIHKSLANYIESMEKELEVATKKFNQELTKEFIETNDIMLGENGHEELDRLEKAVDKLSRLFSKGVEIYAPLTAPKETVSLFPTYKEPLKIATKVRELISGEDKE